MNIGGTALRPSPAIGEVTQMMSAAVSPVPPCQLQRSGLRATDQELLAQLIGARESQRLYNGSLRPFFDPSATDSPPAQCVAALELVKRWLAEEIFGKAVFAYPEAVKDYLKLHFTGRGYESFVIVYVDAQNCLIDVEELFRGTLTQTAV